MVMTEQDGHEMLVARCKALEQIALECFEELCSPLSKEICEQRLERAIENIAPGCGHIRGEQ
jgi:hypothetical protein